MIFLDKSTRLTQVMYQAANVLFLLYLSKHLCPLYNFAICVHKRSSSLSKVTFLALTLLHPLPQSSSSDVSLSVNGPSWTLLSRPFTHSFSNYHFFYLILDIILSIPPP